MKPWSWNWNGILLSGHGHGTCRRGMNLAVTLVSIEPRIFTVCLLSFKAFRCTLSIFLYVPL